MSSLVSFGLLISFSFGFAHFAALVAALKHISFDASMNSKENRKCTTHAHTHFLRNGIEESRRRSCECGK